MDLISLPIDSILLDITEYLKLFNTIILQATPGAGKTTRVPPALLKVTDKNILVLEPRRLAARLSAQRVSDELGEKCGETVGFQVRFEKCESSKTRIKFITEGLFLRLILNDPQLKNIGCIVIDEFHERHIHTDIALMLVKLLQQTTRPDLKLVVMSATLETKNLAEYLPHAKTFISESKNYSVTLEYLSGPDLNKSLELNIYLALEDLLKKHACKGHILIFLPGSFEIKKTADFIADLAQKYSIAIYQLKADIPIAEQQKIFAPSQKQKIILSTNVAETSITIEGISAVIDSGLAKIAGHASWSGLSTLDIKNISKASCIL